MALYFLTVSDSIHAPLCVPLRICYVSLVTHHWPQLVRPCVCQSDVMNDEMGRMTAAYEHGEMAQEQYEERIRAMYGRSFRRFVLDRNTDVTGVSGTGVVAEGVEFTDGVCVLHWVGAWPSSVVHYDRGLDSVLHVHGHDGRTVVRFLDGPSAGVPHDHLGHDHGA